MPGHRFFCKFDTNTTEAVISDQDELQHLSKVLRLKTGDPVELINGCGGLSEGLIQNISKVSAAITLTKKSFNTDKSPFKVTLACAIPKRSKFETIIEKCTELGVDRIIPLITQRTEIDRHEERLDKKVERFKRVALNAAKQSKRLWFPELTEPMSFHDAITMEQSSEAKIFIPWLEGDRPLLSKALNDAGTAKKIIFFIGPEGDFTNEEIDQAKEIGAIPVSLGPNVLKVDTAAMLVTATKIWLSKDI
jgi:16S rRNA (uracil1498-N3)-methyltransferase